MKNADRVATGGSFLDTENDLSPPDSNDDSDVNPVGGGHRDREIVFLVCGSLYQNLDLYQNHPSIMIVSKQSFYLSNLRKRHRIHFQCLDMESRSV